MSAAVRIGFIGVGSVGSAMVARLATTGHDVRFTARRPEVREQVEQLGGRSQDSVGAVASDADVVVVCVFSDDQVREVCLGPDGVLATLPEGGTLVVHTTCSPDTLVLLGEVGRTRRLQVLDAAFSGGPADVAKGELTVLVGGDPEVLERVRPWLSAYAEPVLHVGNLGDAQRVKLVNNALFGAVVGLVVEAERLANDLGLDPARAFAAMAECSGNSYALGVARMVGSAAALRQGVGRYIEKDVATAQALAVAAGTDLGLLAAVATLAHTSEGVAPRARAL